MSAEYYIMWDVICLCRQVVQQEVVVPLVLLFLLFDLGVFGLLFADLPSQLSDQVCIVLLVLPQCPDNIFLQFSWCNSSLQPSGQIYQVKGGLVLCQLPTQQIQRYLGIINFTLLRPESFLKVFQVLLGHFDLLDKDSDIASNAFTVSDVCSYQ